MDLIIAHPFLAIIFALGILIFVHELGHFLVGKAFGIGVEGFYIGFGPKLIGFRYKNTQYQISLLPLGGYVKFAGGLPSEDAPPEFRGKELYNASFLAQFFTLLAGPLANLLLAVMVYAFLGSKGIEHPSPIIGQVRHGSPAFRAGVLSGDTVRRVNGVEVLSWTDMQENIAKSPEKTVDLEILRKGQTVQIHVSPETHVLEDAAGRVQKQGRIGIGYGFLPPIIDLLPGRSEARSANFQSGNKVTKVVAAGRDFPIHTWDEFEEALKTSYESKASSLILELEDSEKKPLGSKVLKTDAWKKAQDSSANLANLLGITDSQFTVSKLEEPASFSLKAGDRILAFEGQGLEDIYSLFEILQKNEKEKVNLKIQRRDKMLSLEVQLKPVEIQKASGKAILYALPVSFVGGLVAPPSYMEIYPNVFSSLKFAVKTTLQQSFMLVGVIGGLFIGDVPLKSLGGPILVAKIAESSAKRGVDTFLTSLAVISINLGVINLFPIPILDGGKLLMVTIEAIFRRKLKPAFVENYQKIGFVLILALMVLATYNDLSRFWSSILQSISGAIK